MMPDPDLRLHSVSGAGPFPTHLLSMDKCWPASQLDGRKIAKTFTSTDEMTILLSSYEDLSWGSWRRAGWIAKMC